ncbi:MAG: hypothetical protein V4613_00635 [Bacteroidota bacterium]
MDQLSPLIIALFILITLYSIYQFFKASGNSKNALLILFTILLVQGILGFTGFYLNFNTIPPRFVALLGPSLLIIILLFSTKKGRQFLDTLNLQKLTILHTLRIPVEIVLYAIFSAGLIPETMTFEGANFDMLSGISAPIIAYLVFKTKALSMKALLIWNFVTLFLLINILTIAILALPTPIQQVGLDQPNIGVGYFPFVWLPAIIVPLVMLSHLASIRQLLKAK